MMAEVFLVIGLVGLLSSIWSLKWNNEPKWRNVVDEKFVRKLLGEIVDHTHMEIVGVDVKGDVIKVYILTSTITSNSIERVKEVARRHNLDLEYTDVTVFSFKRGRWSR
jgi:hypothetical protein